MPLSLADSAWNQLRGCHADTRLVVAWLEEAYDRGTVAEGRLGDLIDAVSHQGDTSTAMYAVAPHLISIAERTSEKSALTLLTHAGLIYAASSRPGAVPCPEFLRQDFDRSASEGAKRLCLLLPLSTGFESYKWAVAALAGFLGHHAFARFLDGLDYYDGQFHHDLLEEPLPEER